MAIEVRPFEPGDLDALRLQAAQAIDAMAGDRATRVAMAELGPSFTATCGDRVLLCAGMVENHAHYATAWALLAEEIGRAHLALTRATRQVCAAARYRRLDMIVRSDWPAAHKWARCLGFAREGTFAAWAPDGGDVDVYARIAAGGAS